MATNYRTTQTSDWVHVSDSDAKPLPDGMGTAERDWLPAATQPATCTRFSIRSLSSDEWAELVASEHPDEYAVKNGLRLVDGEAPELSVFSPSYKQAIAKLVAALTLSGPLAFRPSKSADSNPTG